MGPAGAEEPGRTLPSSLQRDTGIGSELESGRPLFLSLASDVPGHYVRPGAGPGGATGGLWPEGVRHTSSLTHM